MKPTRGQTPSATRTAYGGLLGGGRTPGSHLANTRTPMRHAVRIANHHGVTASARKDKDSVVRDPVEVFCRIRPDESEEPCIQVISESTLKLVQPEASRAYGNGKETQCSFKHVFEQSTNQGEVFDRVGLPLVADLLQGKNGLLFTYGVTGSGKTHTMQGSNQDGGTLPRAIDVIFNSIDDIQTKKFQLKPDKLNGFEIQSDTDAALDRQNELVNNIKTPRRPVRSNNNSNEDLSNRIANSQKVAVQEDYQYSVFVSYVEIYNNYTYDLLDSPKMDIVSGRMKLTSKMLREDSYRNMYVHGAVEVEVKSPEEALETFYKGQKQRRVAETQLNMESSRSHSIFNIRVIAVPLDALGEDILSDNAHLVVSQLALVDLAGSERTNRTGNTGARLAEASKINQSLMTLRTCIEVLRDNQNSGSNKSVPYRDSRVTHLFRNYFEGDGKVKMIVCVNPRSTDYDENINVMKFAELTQEVVIERAKEADVRFNNGLTPGRRRANQVYKEAIRRMEEEGQDVADMVMDLAPVYSLGPAWPPLDVTQFDQEEIIEKLKVFLEKRLVTRKTLISNHDDRTRKFRDALVEMEKEVVLLRAENKQLKNQLESERKRTANLETKLVNAEYANKSLTNKVAAYSETKMVLENELDDKELQVNQIRDEKQKLKQKYSAKLQRETGRVESELKKEFSDREQRIREHGYKQQAKINALKNIVNDTDSNDENIENGAVGGWARHPHSDPNLTSLVETRRSVRPTTRTSSAAKRAGSSSPTRRMSSAVSGSRHRRSRSTDVERWLDHRPVVNPVLSTAVLQPVLKKKRSGDVIPTIGGGRQVVFNDVEVHTHESPERDRKRSYEDFRGIGARIKDLEHKAGMVMEGTPLSKTKRSRI